MSPMCGFCCPLDKGKKDYHFCFYKCPSRCMELPILMNLSESRENKSSVYSVTEILKPPRIVNYTRQVDIYPDPFSLMFMSFGSAFHSLIEGRRGDCAGLTFEHQLHFTASIEVGDRTITLRGTPDQWDDNTKTLTDYKTSGYYAVKLLMDGKWEPGDHRTQVNLYRRYRFPDCKKMQLVMLIKDFNRRLKHEGIPPLVTINVPFIQDAELDTDVKIRLYDILEGESDWMDSRDCTDDERWTHWKTKERVRCEDYCMVKSECPQYRGEQK